MNRAEEVFRHVGRLLHQPWNELSRWQRAIRVAIELGSLGAQQLRFDRAPQMAAALAFRTLFGLVPTLVVTTILVRALGGFADFEAMVAAQLGGLRSDPPAAVAGAGAPDRGGGAAAPATTGAAGAAGDPSSAPESLEQADAAAEDVIDLVLSVVDAVESINLAALTWVGVIVLGYSAISLMVTIEGCFNVVCRAPTGRSWLRRLPVYWTVLCLAPALLALAQFVDRRVDGFLMNTLPSGGMLLRGAAVAWSIALTTLALTLVYRLVPTVAPPLRHVVAGAFVATLGIEAAWRLFGAYVDHALSLQQLTGSLGLVPLFMFWIYLLWLVILFGLEVAKILERRGRGGDTMRTIGRTPNVVDPATILLVAGSMATRFREGRPADVDELAADTGLPAAAVESLVDQMIEAGIAHRVAAEGEPVTFSRPPEMVAVADLLALGREAFAGEFEAEGAVAGVLDRLRAAERGAAEGLTIAALGPPEDPPARSAGR